MLFSACTRHCCMPDFDITIWQFIVWQESSVCYSHQAQDTVVCQTHFDITIRQFIVSDRNLVHAILIRYKTLLYDTLWSHHQTVYCVWQGPRARYHQAQDVVWWWSQLASWCLEPSEPLGVTSGLNMTFNQSLSYSAHKSSKINHNTSTAQLSQTHTHTQNHTYFYKTTTFLYHS